MSPSSGWSKTQAPSACLSLNPRPFRKRRNSPKATLLLFLMSELSPPSWRSGGGFVQEAVKHVRGQQPTLVQLLAHRNHVCPTHLFLGLVSAERQHGIRRTMGEDEGARAGGRLLEVEIEEHTPQG